MSRGARLAAHGAVSTALALCGDRALGEIVDAAVPLGTGIGGKSALLEAAGTPVFVKRVPLTDLERRPENVRSTANLFTLPVFCRYGLGGPGYGAWRELAVHPMTTNWVLAGSTKASPDCHWRVLPDSGLLPGELADVERDVAYWGGGPEVRHRIGSLRRSSACVALFLEYIPQNLHEWLGAQVGAGEEATAWTCCLVEGDLQAGVSFTCAARRRDVGLLPRTPQEQGGPVSAGEDPPGRRVRLAAPSEFAPELSCRRACAVVLPGGVTGGHGCAGSQLLMVASHMPR
jgi:hypothetical protein